MQKEAFISLSEKVRADLIKKTQFPNLKVLLENSSINYKTKYADKIINALIEDPNLSRYSLISIFDDRILVSDSAGIVYHLPYTIEKDILTFGVIVPTSLAQNESMLIKSVLLKEIEKMTQDFVKGKVSENSDKIVRLALEKLRLDEISSELQPTAYSKLTPVFLFRSKNLTESWVKFSHHNKSKLTEKVELLSDLYATIVNFRNFLEEKGYAKYGHYINSSQAEGYMKEFAMYRGTELEEKERATLINFFKNRVKFLEENALFHENAVEIGDVVRLKFGDNYKIGYKVTSISPDGELVYVEKDGEAQQVPYHISQVEKDAVTESLNELSGVQTIQNPTIFMGRTDVTGQEVVPDAYSPNSANSSPLSNYMKILLDGQAFLNKAISDNLPEDLKKAVNELLSRVNDFIVKINTSYQFAQSDMEELQDITRTLIKMINIASGLDMLKVRVDDTEEELQEPSDASLTPTQSYLGDADKVEVTTTGQVATYPAKFYKDDKEKDFNPYPAPVRVGESVVVRDGMFIVEGKVAGFNKWTGFYDVKLLNGKILQLDESDIDFDKDTVIATGNEPELLLDKEDEDDEQKEKGKQK